VWNPIALTHQALQSVKWEKTGKMFLQKKGPNNQGVPPTLPNVFYMVGFAEYSQLQSTGNFANFTSYQLCVRPINYVWEKFADALARIIGSPKFHVNCFMGGISINTGNVISLYKHANNQHFS
jgi:hypothetical protein